MNRSSIALSVSYVLPIRRTSVDWNDLAELRRYLDSLHDIDVIVADGSDADVFEAHRVLAAPHVRHLHVDPAAALNGKVAGVLAGLRIARNDAVIIADDDVRYDRHTIERMCTELERAAVVRPQNYFDPLPWHARLDTGRSLFNRALDGDWPGTLGVRRDLVLRAGGYDGDVLFENLELVRTVRAAGGSERIAHDVFVRRLPPTMQRFFLQRVRQAYDEFARPARLLAMLAVLPGIAALVRRRRIGALAALALTAVGTAEYGRRRSGGSRYFHRYAAWTAPAWILERAVCSWLALFLRFFAGGVRYSNGRIRRAASPMRRLRERLA